MTPHWTERVFDDRLAPLRAATLALVLAGDLLLVHPPGGAADWTLALAGLALSALALSSGRARRRTPPGLSPLFRPLSALTALSALLVAAHALGSGIVPSLKVLAAVTLFDLAARERGRVGAAGAITLALAVVVNRLDDLPGQTLPVLYKTAVVAGLPLLLGAYVRTVRTSASRSREHAAAERDRARERLDRARSDERAAISRELHDLVAHHVSSMVLRVGVARHVLPTDGDPRVGEVLDDLHASGSAALADLRRLVTVLRTPVGAVSAHGGAVDGAPSPFLPRELPAALAETADRARRTGLTVHVEVDPVVGALDPVRGLTVLRLAQEGLANTAAHAGPGATATLTVRLPEADTVRLTLQDDGGDGRAGSTAGDPSPTGYGLIGMRERVNLLGGRLTAGPPVTHPAPSKTWDTHAERPTATHSGPPLTGWLLEAELPPPVTPLPRPSQARPQPKPHAKPQPRKAASP